MGIFSGWLHLTQRLQWDVYGVDPTRLEGSDYAEYLRLNGFAAMVELGEFAQKRQWKPYKVEGRNEATRAEALEEIVDVLHHLANLLILERVTDQELSDAYLGKVEKNRQRADHHKISKPELDMQSRRSVSHYPECPMLNTAIGPCICRYMGPN